MSDPTPSSLPPVPAQAPVEAARATPVAAVTDGRIRVLCPAGIDRTTAWPDGRAPLMAYVIYSHCPNQL